MCVFVKKKGFKNVVGVFQTFTEFENVFNGTNQKFEPKFKLLTKVDEKITATLGCDSEFCFSEFFFVKF